MKTKQFDKKDGEICNEYTCVQKSGNRYFFVKYDSGSVVHITSVLDHWEMMIYNQFDQ